jgi:DNA-dependent RNA polymerase auxiliary subunit epsilon
MLVGSNTRAHVNKRNVAVVFHIPKEALKACLLPKRRDPSYLSTVKKQPRCQYQEAYLLVKHLNQMKQLLKKKESNKEKVKDLSDMSTRQKYESNKEAFQ